MPKQQSSSSDSQLPFIVTNTPLVLCILATLLLAGSTRMWWSKVHDSPRRVFSAMLSNNLSTVGVTRQTLSSDSTNLDKSEQISFVPPYAVRSLITVSQEEGTSKSSVVTETIGTLANDYSRYVNIETNQKSTSGKELDYSSVEGTWGKSGIANGQAQYFQQSILGLVPFANLDAKTRDSVLDLLVAKEAYVVDYSMVKPLRTNGKSALVYPVKVDAARYVAVLKALGKGTGIGDLPELNANDYSGQPPIEISITVDKLSRHVLEVSYGQQVEKYTSYGLNTPVATPSKTISIDDLQQKVQEIQ